MNELVGGLDRVAASHKGWVESLWVEMRPRQWVKNAFVLPPLLFSHNLLDPVAVGQSLATFILFCLASSSVYLLNDIHDRKQDSLHPTKRLRPLAAGELNVRTALGAMATFVLLTLVGGVMLNKTLALILLCYWFINLLYSSWLKHQVILDVFALTAGFILRVLGGAVVIQVEVSHWLLLCTMLLAFFLGFSKRRHELVVLGSHAETHRRVLAEYNPHFLDMMISIVTASTVMSYALYTVSTETVERFHTRELLLTLPFVLYGIFRYLYLVYQKNQGEDPTQSLLADRPMVINLCLWALTAGLIVYRQ